MNSDPLYLSLLSAVDARFISALHSLCRSLIVGLVVFWSTGTNPRFSFKQKLRQVTALQICLLH